MFRVVVVLCALCAIARADDAPRAPDAPPPPKVTNVVTKAPKQIQAQAPEYPPAALAAGKQAKVKVRIHIDETGIVTAVDVMEKVGAGFDEAAVAAAMQYIFEPAEIDGKPGAITVETTSNFVIEQQAAPDEPPPPPPPQTHEGPANHAGALKAPITLQGVVVERGTRKKLAGVIVSIAELGIDVVTGDAGVFYFHGVPPGTYTILAVDDRYDRFKRPIAISKKEALEVRLWMRPRGGNPYETVIEGVRETMEVSKRTLQRQQLTSIPGTFGDPIRVIQTLPGMQRAPFGLGLLLVRGSNPDDTGIFVDGHEVPGLFHFLGGPSIFTAEMLESLDLYPGGFPGRCGRHHGGVVALETRPTKSDGIHGSAKIDFIDAGGYIRAPITDDLSVAVAGRRSYIDAFLGFVLPEPTRGAQRIVTPIYYDYQARERVRDRRVGLAPRAEPGSRRGGVDEPQQLGRLPARDRLVRAPDGRRSEADVVTGVGPRHDLVQRRAGDGEWPVHEPRRDQRQFVVPDAGEGQDRVAAHARYRARHAVADHPLLCVF